MSTEIGNVYIPGDTAIFDNTITDLPTPIGTGEAIDPDSHIIKLIKPDGTQEGENMITPNGGNGSGNKGYFWQAVLIPEDAPTGEWILEWQIFINLERNTERIRFRVVD